MHLVDVRATEVAVQRRLEIEVFRARVGHGQLGLQSGPVKGDLFRRRVRSVCVQTRPHGGTKAAVGRTATKESGICSTYGPQPPPDT